MTTTFAVSEVGKKDDEGFWTSGGYYKPKPVTLVKAFSEIAKNRRYAIPEALGGTASMVLPCAQADGFFNAVHTAFKMHYGLALSPDHIWLTIMRQVAKHLTANAEDLRKKFVDHEGQENIEVRRDAFVKGSQDNDWEGAFNEFGEQIGKRIKVDHLLFLSNFTTTGVVEKAASEAILMDAMSKYFTYSMRTCCGIPEITLLGTPEDWTHLQAKTWSILALIGLGTWAEELSPVLEQFVRAANGDVDTEWWQSFYKHHSMSGGDTITGHFVKLYNTPKNQPRSWTNQSGGQAMTSEDIPDALSIVPFLWHYYEKTYKMQFLAGLPFATLENGVVRPVAAWAVSEAT